MVPADSQQIPRARCYSGNPTTCMPLSSTTGLSPSPAGNSKPLHLTTTHKHDDGSHRTLGPTTPHTQPLPGITCTRFSLIHVRSPLLAESLLFSPPTGTEMFHFPAFAFNGLCIQPKNNLLPHQLTFQFPKKLTNVKVGFPHSEIVGSKPARSSPTLIAACHVLHRLYVPRNPPDALKTLDLQPNRCCRSNNVPISSGHDTKSPTK